MSEPKSVRIAYCKNLKCGSLEYQIIEEGKEPPKCEACCRQMTISSASMEPMEKEAD